MKSHLVRLRSPDPRPSCGYREPLPQEIINFIIFFLRLAEKLLQGKPHPEGNGFLPSVERKQRPWSRDGDWPCLRRCLHVICTGFSSVCAATLQYRILGNEAFFHLRFLIAHVLLIGAFASRDDVKIGIGQFIWKSLQEPHLLCNETKLRSSFVHR